MGYLDLAPKLAVHDRMIPKNKPSKPHKPNDGL